MLGVLFIRRAMRSRCTYSDLTIMANVFSSLSLFLDYMNDRVISLILSAIKKTRPQLSISTCSFSLLLSVHPAADYTNRGEFSKLVMVPIEGLGSVLLDGSQ